MNTKRAIIRDIGDLIFNLVKNMPFAVILASACRNEVDSFPGELMDQADGAGR